EYAKLREAFGQKIGQFQMIQQKLADMKCRVEASKLLIYQAALAKTHAYKTGGRFSLEASMAKLFASETAMYVTTEAIQIHGGMGLMSDLPLERIWRDARVERIWEGTSEIQRHIISRALLRPLGG
ncbi:acyl-CoA dehydrogenase family protein, partial [Aestuariivirga sp.]|uniref:acyl-CoA dehydrogenase family protein n=1 Tax=Aestuariivirga sp. TaxID=2650926 RepID=UPI0030186134